VLVPCGHAKNAKGHDEYQTVGALLALCGMAALVFDPIDQGERGQYLDPDGWPKHWSTRAHTMFGIGCTLLGRNTARFEIWDAMQAIDYLQADRYPKAWPHGPTRPPERRGQAPRGSSYRHLSRCGDGLSRRLRSCSAVS
jgi:hypothetical protein